MFDQIANRKENSNMAAVCFSETGSSNIAAVVWDLIQI